MSGDGLFAKLNSQFGVADVQVINAREKETMS